MSRNSRFKKGSSGNPRGRPRKSRGQGTVYDVILDQRIAGSIDGAPDELTPEEAIEQQLLKNAFDGKAMAIRKVVKMIEKWQSALSGHKVDVPPKITDVERFSSDSANDALLILEIAAPDMRVGGVRWNISTWATQAALSRPGRKKFNAKQVREIKYFTFHPHKLRWPKGRINDE